MASDYEAISKANAERFGTEIDRLGHLLLADRYSEPAHFLLELLQNAEDALQRRSNKSLLKSIRFHLSESELRVSHFGDPFSEADVRAICDIGLGTKGEDLTAVGRFGIGFKSVFKITSSPQIHSGDEHFAIESFVRPRRIPPIETEPGETLFVFPLRDPRPVLHEAISSGLQGLDLRTLLFLRQIDEVQWRTEEARAGHYLRENRGTLGQAARLVQITGHLAGAVESEQERWIVFSRPVSEEGGRPAGFVEIAFALDPAGGGQLSSPQRLPSSPLVVFFPTVVPTNLGFLVQGPYRTTPSRDNVPRSDPWNQHLVRETGVLLISALEGLRDLGVLDAGALRTLPIDRTKFPEDSMFGPLFDAVKEALATKPLLPCSGGGHGSAKEVKLAGSAALRELLSPDQLAAVFGGDARLSWLSEQITRPRTPELFDYLTDELKVDEVDPADVVPRLSPSFVEAQSDDWIVRLYSFLLEQKALLRSGALHKAPLLRLEDGRHVAAGTEDEPAAYLPGPTPTDYPTVRRAICADENAAAFLSALKLRQPDVVDDFLAHVAPRYQSAGLEFYGPAYEADLARLLAAYRTDSRAQRQRLTTELRSVPFTRVADAGTGERKWAAPQDTYLAAPALKTLFEGVPGVLLTDDSIHGLTAKEMQEALEACGASRHLEVLSVQTELDYSTREVMRANTGNAGCTGEERVADHTLRGLDSLLDLLPDLDPPSSARRARLIWESLCELYRRDGDEILNATYSWFYYSQRYSVFDAAFVKRLNETPWVPTVDGQLVRPSAVVFEEIDPPWEPNSGLQWRIPFKSSAISLLAKEAGIEASLIDLLKERGLTTREALEALLGPATPTGQPERRPVQAEAGLTPESAIEAILGFTDGTGTDTGGASGEALVTGQGDGAQSGRDPGGATRDLAGGRTDRGTGSSGDPRPAPALDPTEQREGQSGSRQFVSYVGVQLTDEDPDDLAHHERMGLEERALEMVIAIEPGLQRMPAQNPGFDLVELDASGREVRWVEVKAMTGTLDERPVGLSRPQFEAARQHASAYWLYIVENATSARAARLVKIQDPAGQARTFTFDRGWRSIAAIQDLASSAVTSEQLLEGDAGGEDRDSQD